MALRKEKLCSQNNEFLTDICKQYLDSQAFLNVSFVRVKYRCCFLKASFCSIQTTFGGLPRVVETQREKGTCQLANHSTEFLLTFRLIPLMIYLNFQSPQPK